MCRLHESEIGWTPHLICYVPDVLRRITNFFDYLITVEVRINDYNFTECNIFDYMHFSIHHHDDLIL